MAEVRHGEPPGQPLSSPPSTYAARQESESWGVTKAQGAPPFSPQMPGILASWAAHTSLELPPPVSRGAGLFSLLGTFLDFKNK